VHSCSSVGPSTRSEPCDELLHGSNVQSGAQFLRPSPGLQFPFRADSDGVLAAPEPIPKFAGLRIPGYEEAGSRYDWTDSGQPLKWPVAFALF